MSRQANWEAFDRDFGRGLTRDMLLDDNSTTLYFDLHILLRSGIVIRDQLSKDFIDGGR